ncbi:hypothetical protein ACJX0J_030557, partial [Zea mays]
ANITATRTTAFLKSNMVVKNVLAYIFSASLTITKTIHKAFKRKTKGFHVKELIAYKNLKGDFSLFPHVDDDVRDHIIYLEMVFLHLEDLSPIDMFLFEFFKKLTAAVVGFGWGFGANSPMHFHVRSKIIADVNFVKQHKKLELIAAVFIEKQPILMSLYIDYLVILMLQIVIFRGHITQEICFHDLDIIDPGKQKKYNSKLGNHTFPLFVHLLSESIYHPLCLAFNFCAAAFFNTDRGFKHFHRWN